MRVSFAAVERSFAIHCITGTDPRGWWSCSNASVWFAAALPDAPGGLVSSLKRVACHGVCACRLVPNCCLRAFVHRCSCCQASSPVLTLRTRQCLPGEYTDVRQQGSTEIRTCRVCPLGTRSTNGAALACTNCAPGACCLVPQFCLLVLCCCLLPRVRCHIPGRTLRWWLTRAPNCRHFC